MSVMTMDPLLIAEPPTKYTLSGGDKLDKVEDVEVPFESYCIVCDKRIIQPDIGSGKGGVQVVGEGKGGKAKKKTGGGTIRVKNPDGTTTTRNANGKVTRPPLKRNPQSANSRVVSTSTAKVQPLPRAKTAEAAVPTSDPFPVSPSPLLTRPSISTQTQKAKKCGDHHKEQFVSAIYCSRECQDTDAGRSTEAYKDISRAMSFDFSHAFYSPDGEPLPVADSRRKSSNSPSSPLLVSGSDTESSTSTGGSGSGSGTGRDAEIASSAPKMLGYFRFEKEAPDAAWRELERQRRSSMQPSFHRQTPNGQSSDSLSSLGLHETEISRSVSGGGRLRGMTPFYSPDQERRVSASGSEKVRAVPIPVRPMARSNLSQTSLAASSSSQQSHLPPEFGSAPTHTLGLLQSYASAFPMRSSCNTPNSFSQRGFVFPDGAASPSPAATALMAEAGRRDSACSISRPVSGTIKAKRFVGGEPTWDSLGKEAVKAQNERTTRRYGGLKPTIQTSKSDSATFTTITPNSSDSTPVAVPRRNRDPSVETNANTPIQVMEREGQGWKIKYRTPGRSRSRGTDVASSLPDYHPNGVSISRQSPAQAGNATPAFGSHTPSSRVPVRPMTYVPKSTMASSQALDAAMGVPVHSVGHDENGPRRIGFNWEGTKGVMTYEIPGRLDKNQKGLFYFQ